MHKNFNNIRVVDSSFYGGLGSPSALSGRLNDVFEAVENITAENVLYNNTLHAFYVKTWTDDQNGYPPNGGGGGLGYASNMRLSNLKANGLRGAAFSISQCTRFAGAPGQGNCTNSQFQLRDIGIEGLTGTTWADRVASLQCSAVAPCTDVTLEGIDLRLKNGSEASSYLCGNVVDPKGWECTGPVCEGGSATGEC